MKILLISNLYPPYERGGAEFVVRSEARELRDAGHAVWVLTSAPFSGLRSLWPRVSREDDITVLRFFPLNLYWCRNDYKHHSATRFFWHILDSLSVHGFAVTRYALKKIRPDCVRTHNCKGAGFLSVAAVRASGVRWVHFLHDVQLLSPSGLLMAATLPRGTVFRAYRTLCRWIFGAPHCIEAPSRWIMDLHRREGFFSGSSIEILQWFSADSVAPPLERWRPERPLSLLFVGQIAHHKGILFLLDVLAGMPNGLFMLQVVGDGPQMRELEERARGIPWIVLHGRLSQQEVQRHLSRVDVLAVPSLAHENAPTVIVAALKAGRPVIASRVGGIPELVSAGRGWLVRAGDTQAWRDALERVIGFGGGT